MGNLKKSFGYLAILVCLTCICIGAISILHNDALITNNELLVTKTENGIRIDNIQNYFKNKKRLTTKMSDTDTVDEVSSNYLKLLNFSEEDISSLSPEQVSQYESAAYVFVDSVSYNVAEVLIDNGVQQHDSKITITTRLFRVPALDTSLRAYRMEAEAFWNNSPSYRLKDILAFNATNDSVFGKSSSGERKANMSYIESYTAYGTSKAFSYDSPSSAIEEYNINAPLFAYRANLPNDVVGIGASNLCYSIKIAMSCTIYNNNAFNVYTSYGHKYVGGAAELSLKGGNIKFGTSCTKYDGKMLSETSAK